LKPLGEAPSKVAEHPVSEAVVLDLYGKVPTGQGDDALRLTSLPVSSISPASARPRIGFLGLRMPTTSRIRIWITTGADLTAYLTNVSLDVTVVAIDLD
jgi:hypothetical protein